MKYRVQINKPNTREHHSFGDAYWNAENEWYDVELDRTIAPFRGQYLPKELQILDQSKYVNQSKEV